MPDSLKIHIQYKALYPWVELGSSILCKFFLPSVITTENNFLTHWGRVTHICVGKLTIIGSDNGLLPGRCQAIIWNNAGILLIAPLGTNQWYHNRNSYIFILENAFENIIWKMVAIWSQPQCVNTETQWRENDQRSWKPWWACVLHICFNYKMIYANVKRC